MLCKCGAVILFPKGRERKCIDCHKQVIRKERLKTYLRLIRKQKEILLERYKIGNWSEYIDFDGFLADEGMYGKLGKLYMLADLWTSANIAPTRSRQYSIKLVK